MTAQMPHNFRIDPMQNREFARPVAWIVRPGKPRCLMRFPLGGKPYVVRSRRHVEQRELFVEQAPVETVVGVDTAIAEKRPMTTGLLDEIQSTLG